MNIHLNLNEELDLLILLANREAQACGEEKISQEHIFLAILRLLDGAINLESSTITKFRDTIANISSYKLKGLSILEIDEFELTKYRRELNKSLYLFDSVKSELLNIDEEIENLLNNLLPSEKNILEILGKLKIKEIKGNLNEKLQEGSIKSGYAKNQQTRQYSDSSSSLGQIGINLTQIANEGNLPPFFGRQQEVDQLIHVLMRTTKRNAILVGPAGVGKTAIVEGLAQKIVSPDCPDFMKSWTIHQINISSIVAGTTYRGEMEERLNQIIEVAQSNPNMILFFDEIHLMINTGSISNSSMDIANIMKPVLSRGNVRIIGATTQIEYERYLKDDSAFQRRFIKVLIDEPSSENAIEICNAWAKQEKDKLQVEFTHQAISKAVEWSIQHIPSRYLPDKAIDLLDSTTAHIKISRPVHTNSKKNHEKIIVSENDVWEELKNYLGVELDKSLMFEPNKIEQALQIALAGQDTAIKLIKDAFEEISLEISNNAMRPISSFLFIGPKICGKTYTAKIITSTLFPENPKQLLILQLDHLKNSYDLSYLVGAAPGLIGHERQGVLFEFIETYSQGVILLENFDQCHIEIQNYLLNILKEGFAIDNHGRRAFFNNYIFVITILDDSINEKVLNSSLSDQKDLDGKSIALHQKKNSSLSNIFSQVDYVVPFDKVSKENMNDLYQILFEKLKLEVKQKFEKEISINLVDSLKISAYLQDVSENFNEFERHFEKKIKKPVVKYIKKSKPANTLIVEWQNNIVTITS